MTELAKETVMELENKSVEGTDGERTPELIAVEINAIKRNARCMMVSSAAEIGKRLIGSQAAGALMAAGASIWRGWTTATALRRI